MSEELNRTKASVRFRRVPVGPTRKNVSKRPACEAALADEASACDGTIMVGVAPHQRPNIGLRSHPLFKEGRQLAATKEPI